VESAEAAVGETRDFNVRGACRSWSSGAGCRRALRAERTVRAPTWRAAVPPIWSSYITCGMLV